MKATFETEDPQEIKRLSSVNDMAAFIWEMDHNFFRGLEGKPLEEIQEKFNQLLEEHGINIDEIWN